MTRHALRTLAAAAAVVVCSAAHLAAQAPFAGGAQMPDPKQMSGVPLPMPDLALGTVTVRVVRGSMANPLANQTVELTVGGVAQTARTNDQGRAEFTGLSVGAAVKATATVDGERLESQEFPVPPSGGVRVALVATDPEAQKRAADDARLAQSAAQPGIVVLGEQSRIVVEAGDEVLNVFNILQIVNTARTPVQPPAPVVFDLPDVAQSAGMLDGSSKQASLANNRVTVNGPFAPGATVVQFAYAVPFGDGEVTVRQKLPVALNQVSVMAQKVGEMRLDSPQIQQHREMPTDGQTYIVGQGAALKAGDTVALTFSGLPHQPLWPRNLALVAAVGILATGLWATVFAGRETAAADARRKKLQSKRDRLFAELTALEEQHRTGAVDRERYGARRRDLVVSLERVYAEIDADAAA
jgi:hypothetical protein